MTNSENVLALHENGVIKTIPTENLESICFKSAFLYCVLRPISWFIPNHIRNLTSNTLGSGIPLVVSWSPFSKQFQNHCKMSMAIMIEWRVLKIWVFWCCGKLILPVIIAKDSLKQSLLLPSHLCIFCGCFVKVDEISPSTPAVNIVSLVCSKCHSSNCIRLIVLRILSSSYVCDFYSCSIDFRLQSKRRFVASLAKLFKKAHDLPLVFNIFCLLLYDWYDWLSFVLQHQKFTALTHCNGSI